MAVVNQVATPLAHPQAAGEVTGSPVMSIVKVINVAATDDIGSVYLIGEIPDTAVVTNIEIESATVAGASDLDIGLYDEYGNVCKKDCYADGLNITNSTGIPTGQLGLPLWSAMTIVGAANARKLAWELATHVNKVVPGVGETQKKSKYKLALTANSDISAAGTLVVRVEYQKTA